MSGSKKLLLPKSVRVDKSQHSLGLKNDSSWSDGGGERL